jgi:membrane-associated phospholipid phosphatase
MPNAKKTLNFFNKLLINGLILVAFNNIACSQNLEGTDSESAPSALRSDTNLAKISIKKSSDNFYKTDSIFSFRSPKGYIPSLLYDFGDQVTAPFRFKTKQWLIAGAASGLTSALFFIDNDINGWARVQRQKHNWINKSSPVITQFGARWGTYSVAGIGILSAVFKNKKGVQTSLLATQAMITSGVWVHLIKMLTGRERPVTNNIIVKPESGNWYGPFAMYDHDLALEKPGSSFNSFPSGHTANAFSIATVFASQYRDIKAIPIISYSIASLVGISRLTENKHWSSDVFAGAFLGFVCGKQVVAHYNRLHQNPVNPLTSKSTNKPELTFIQYENQVGLMVKW